MEMAASGNMREQRKKALKTAWVLAIVAALIFVAFVLSGVLRS
jgi:hypothetical protein